jgi:hypothetical protein
MAFTESEIAKHLQELEDAFWSRHRPPLNLRDQMREGQRIVGRSIELFFVRPAFQRPGVHIEESIAKLQHLPGKGVWRIFWQRADGHWHRYLPCPEVDTLAEALRVVDEDANGCFFG